MITPGAIARVDVLYNPFSAIYPGNSIGTTVVTTEREPRAASRPRRASPATSGASSCTATRADYDGHQLSAFVGSRLDSGLWYSLSANRQNSTSQPMNYYTVSADAAGVFQRSPARPCR